MQLNIDYLMNITKNNQFRYKFRKQQHIKQIPTSLSKNRCWWIGKAVFRIKYEKTDISQFVKFFLFQIPN